MNVLKIVYCSQNASVFFAEAFVCLHLNEETLETLSLLTYSFKQMYKQTSM